MILHKCPQCEARLESPEDFAGHKDQCPLCGQMYVVPRPRASSWMRESLSPAQATIRRHVPDAEQDAAVEALLEATDAPATDANDPPEKPFQAPRSGKLSPVILIVAGVLIGFGTVLLIGFGRTMTLKPDNASPKPPETPPQIAAAPAQTEPPSTPPEPTEPTPKPPLPTEPENTPPPNTHENTPRPQNPPDTVGPDMWPDIKPQPEPQPQPKPKPKPEPEPEPEPKPEPKPEPSPKPKPLYVLAKRSRPAPKPAEQYKPLLALTSDAHVPFDLVLVPQGKFSMGSPSGRRGEIERDEDEMIHDVVLTYPYYLGQCEVTQKQYQAVTGKLPPQSVNDENAPVTNISWPQAVAFCRMLSAKTHRVVRLPTEAEWERACRAGTTTPFSTGPTIRREQANYNGKYVYGLGSLINRNFKGSVALEPVRQYPPNDFKLFDMHGNAAEWCWDWYGQYDNGLVTDPVGPPEGDKRVLRGGSWLVPARRCRSANRDNASPEHTSDSIGFRILVETEPADLGDAETDAQDD